MNEVNLVIGAGAVIAVILAFGAIVQFWRLALLLIMAGGVVELSFVAFSGLGPVVGLFVAAGLALLWLRACLALTSA